MIPSDKPESLTEFMGLLDSEFPGYKFNTTPAEYDSETFEPMRGVVVRTPKGELLKLRTVLRAGLADDAYVSKDLSPPDSTINLEQEVKNVLIQEIRKEMEKLDA